MAIALCATSERFRDVAVSGGQPGHSFSPSIAEVSTIAKIEVLSIHEKAERGHNSQNA